MKAYLFLLNLLLAVAFSPEATNAQSETADDLFPESTQILTLDLQHVDRYYYLILVDGKVVSHLEGYAVNHNTGWARSPLQVPQTIILDNLTPGKHFVTVETHQEPGVTLLPSREEYLYEYEPFTFEVAIDPLYITHQTIDLREALTLKLAGYLKTGYHSDKWKVFSEIVSNQRMEIRVRQHRKGDDVDGVTKRLDLKGVWVQANKHIYYLDVEVKLNDRLLLAEYNIPYSGIVTYSYWNDRRTEWQEDSFFDNVINRKTPVSRYVRTVSLTNSHELRLAAHDRSITYTIVRNEQSPHRPNDVAQK